MPSHPQILSASANLFFQAFLDSLQVDLLDAGSNGSVFQLLVVVELSYHVWRRVPVPSLGDWWLARVCCRWAGLRGGRLGGRVGRHSWARNLWARSRWGRCLGRRRRGDPEAGEQRSPVRRCLRSLGNCRHAWPSWRPWGGAFLASTLVLATRRHCHNNVC